MLVRRIIKFFIPEVVQKLLRIFFVLSEGYGQRQSIRQRTCVDGDGYEIPWYTYPAIEYLKGLDFSNSEILEFGSGSSSIWWSQRAESVLAVENNREWYEKIRESNNDKLKVVLAESERDYLAAGKGKNFDVIVIDGVYRQQCVEVVSEALSENGLVILDNSDWHPETARVLREQYNFLQVDFHGFGPINSYTWTTSLFFSRTFLCVPCKGRLPGYSVAALIQLAEGQEPAPLKLQSKEDS